MSQVAAVGDSRSDVPLFRLAGMSIALNATPDALIAAWDGWRGSFYKLVVHPEQRRQSLATELLREGESRLRARRAVRLTAIVAEDDPAAMAFWKAVGYFHQPQQTRFIRHTQERAR
jgi:ribosomal protein S18 acetylase RimI-like enzyme